MFYGKPRLNHVPDYHAVEANAACPLHGRKGEKQLPRFICALQMIS